MNRTAFALTAVLALAAHAEAPDPSGQFAARASGARSSDEVATELASFRKVGVNPWSTSYNPLASFRSEKTRAQVQAEFLADRQAAAAMNSEDSGSAFFTAHRQESPRLHQFAGQATATTR